MSSKKKESVIRYLDTIQPVEVRWLVKPFLPLGKFSLLIGDSGVGKSTISSRAIDRTAHTGIRWQTYYQ